MATFAHIETGFALDPHENDDAAAYRARFQAAIVSDWTIVEVPGATAHGAKDNGDGTFTNPPPTPAPDPTPIPVSKTAFQDLAVANLGGSTTGMARFQAIMDACEAGSGAVKFCFSRYEAAQIFAKDQVAAFTSIMVAASIMTANERTAILAAWPSA